MKHVTFKGGPPVMGEGVVLNADPLMLDIDAVSKNRFRIPIKHGVVIGKDCDFGANVVINKGTLSDTIIGDNVFIGHNSIIGHDCKIGNHVLIGAGVIICGHVTLGDYTHVAVGSIVLPNLLIGKNVFIGAGSLVNRSIAQDNVIAYGSPCNVVRDNKWRP